MATASSPLYYILIAVLISSASLFTICRASRGGGRREIVELGGRRTLKQAPKSSPKKEVSFAYTDDTKGPNKWGALKPEWKTCGNGKSQSPIDLVNGKVQVQESLGPLKITHKAAPAKISNRGYDISVAWEGDAGSIQINGKDYKLAQIHWHSPSEHIVKGTSYALEGHIVHKSADGGIAVIGILYNVGNADPFLSKVLKNIKTLTEEGTDLGSINPNDITFDRYAYYRYTGSLTTPPCTEGVIWTVIKTVRTASAEQVNALKAAVYDGFQKNARPVQNVQGRTINLSSKN